MPAWGRTSIIIIHVIIINIKTTIIIILVVFYFTFLIVLVSESSKLCEFIRGVPVKKNTLYDLCDHAFNITPVASGYQEIHPYSAMNIDSVKINISLIMMKEWL